MLILAVCALAAVSLAQECTPENLLATSPKISAKAYTCVTLYWSLASVPCTMTCTMNSTLCQGSGLNITVPACGSSPAISYSNVTSIELASLTLPNGQLLLTPTDITCGVDVEHDCQCVPSQPLGAMEAVKFNDLCGSEQADPCRASLVETSVTANCDGSYAATLTPTFNDSSCSAVACSFNNGLGTCYDNDNAFITIQASGNYFTFAFADQCVISYEVTSGYVLSVSADATVAHSHNVAAIAGGVVGGTVLLVVVLVVLVKYVRRNRSQYSTL